MPNKVRTHLVGDSTTASALAPKHMTKQQLARRLYQLMFTKGWNQSELGRQADLPRDAISVYVRGKSLPTPQNLKSLADALGVTEAELLPNHIESAIDEDTPAFELRASPSAPNVAWLRVNRLVTFTTGLKIAELLEADRAVDGSGSGGAATM